MSSGQVTITANVENFTPVKVQVLTAYPCSEEARILNEAPINAGQSATLVYDVPKGKDTLFAACVNAEGIYRVTSFVAGDNTVGFAENNNSRRAVTRTVATITLGEGQSSDNVNAKSSSKTTLWRNSTWSDRIYTINGHRTAVSDFTTTEKNARSNEVYGFLPASNRTNYLKVDKTGYYYYANNSLTANGEAPIVVTLIGGQSAMLGWMELYYYYYTPRDMAGMTDAQEKEYLKSVPKFRICDVAEVLGDGSSESERKNNLQYVANVTKDYKNWMKRSYKYTLAYFGSKDNLQTTGTTVFPEGTRIGFMMRLHEGMQNRSNFPGANGNYPIGINMYSDPRLNDEVNRYWYSISPATSHFAIFTQNGRTYFSTEDCEDLDFNDLIFEVEGGFRKYEESTTVDHQVYTFAFEDTPQGDYDLNDVIIKAKRTSNTTVEYSLEATGAKDALYLRNIDGNKLNGNKEIHAIFGQTGRNFINTENGTQHVNAIKETISVGSDFSFSDYDKLPYIYNASKGYEIRLSKMGEDPHGLVIPFDFLYPVERCCVKDAYTRFNDWGLGLIDATTWFKFPSTGKVYSAH